MSIRFVCDSLGINVNTINVISGNSFNVSYMSLKDVVTALKHKGWKQVDRVALASNSGTCITLEHDDAMVMVTHSRLVNSPVRIELISSKVTASGKGILGLVIDSVGKVKDEVQQAKLTKDTESVLRNMQNTLNDQSERISAEFEILADDLSADLEKLYVIKKKAQQNGFIVDIDYEHILVKVDQAIRKSDAYLDKIKRNIEQLKAL